MNTPTCIGIILDGNRRWAKQHGLPSLEGHRQGAMRLRDAARWVRDRGVKHLVVYAFSTENWNRSADEVSYLFELFKTVSETHFEELANEGVRIRFAGQRDRFDDAMRSAMEKIESTSAHNDTLTLWMCLSYGGRAEIVAAAQAAIKAGDLTEESMSAHLWTADMPDPDIIIRTGGEKRLSNFLAWQSVYSELFFIDAFWPDFSESILNEILNEYATRERRMGK